MRWHLRIDTVVGECRRTGHTPSASSSSAKQRADGSVDKRRISSLRSNHGETATTGAALEHRNDTRARSTGLVVESEYPRGESRCNNHTGLVSWSCYGHLQSVCVCRLKHLPAASLGPGPAWLSSSCPDRSSSNSILHTKSYANTPGNATNSSISSSFPAACLVTIFTLAVALLNSAFKVGIVRRLLCTLSTWLVLRTFLYAQRLCIIYASELQLFPISASQSPVSYRTFICRALIFHSLDSSSVFQTAALSASA
jgi:hypothetical protein